MLVANSLIVYCVSKILWYASLYLNCGISHLQSKALLLLSEPDSWNINKDRVSPPPSLLSTLLWVLLCWASSKWLSISVRWFHGGGDWSVNLLHDIFEIFIWGWAVRRCPAHSLLGSRGKQCCQKVIIFKRYGSDLIFVDSRFYTLLNFALGDLVLGNWFETLKMLM